MPAQRPSWNYRAEDGGGIVLDMFPHWNYVLENLFGRVQAVTAKAVTHIPERWDEQGRSYAATADDAAYAIFELDGRHHRPGQLVLGRPRRPRRAGRVPGGRHPRLRGRRPVRLPDPAPGVDAHAGLEPRPADDRGLPQPVARRSRTTPSSPTGSGPSGSSSWPTSTPAAPHPYDLAAGVRGLQLADAGLESSTEGRRVEIDWFERHDARPPPRSRCPTADGGWREVELAEPRALGGPPGGFRTRIAFAAAHVVADPRAENVPGAPAVVDWDATLAFRTHLFRYGLGVAEAMDTAQRNMGLDWPATQELITRSAALAREHGARIASGAGTDHLSGPAGGLSEVTQAYLEQVEFVEGAGSQVIVMASRHLAAVARSAEDYLSVYAHGAGPGVAAGHPALAGRDVRPAAGRLLGVGRRRHGDAYVPGPDQRARRQGRRGEGVAAVGRARAASCAPCCRAGVRLYTGDDFNYPELIEGDGEHHSDALLGAFAAIAPAAAAALAALDDGRRRRPTAAEMAPTLPLSRHLFATPTYYYKTGIAFLAWLNGHQDGFVMVGGLQSARSVVHLARVFELANAARLLTDPELAAHRLGQPAAPRPA